MTAGALRRCPKCGMAADDGSDILSDCGGAFRAWLRKHGRSERCRREREARALYARGLAPFAPRDGHPDVRGEEHLTDAPECSQLWGVAPLPRYELRGRRGGQLWLPLWARVVSDVYRVLLVAGEHDAEACDHCARGHTSWCAEAKRRDASPGALGLAKAHRDRALADLAGDPVLQGAVASVFLLERERLLALHGDLLRVHPRALLAKAADLLPRYALAA